MSQNKNKKTKRNATSAIVELAFCTILSTAILKCHNFIGYAVDLSLEKLMKTGRQQDKHSTIRKMQGQKLYVNKAKQRFYNTTAVFNQRD